MSPPRAALLLLLPLAALSAWPAMPQASPQAVATEERVAERVPVRFRGEVLFDVTQPIGNLDARARGAAIEQRMLRIADGSPQALERLRIEHHDEFTDVYVGDVLVRTVTEADATGTGRTRRQLAADHAVQIRGALAAEFRDRGAASLLRGALVALLATVVLVALLAGLRWVYTHARRRLASVALKWRRTQPLAQLPLLSASMLVTASRAIVSAVTVVVALAVVYAYLEFVLGLFPWTRGFADRMYGAAIAAVDNVLGAVAGYLPNVFNIAVIVLVAHLVIRMLRAFFRHVGEGRIRFESFYPEWAEPTFAILRFLLIAIAFVMVFPYLPASGSEGFRGVSVFIGLLVSLGAASAIANIIAGIVITYMRPFRPGDRVKIADAVGDILDKDLFVVRLRTIKNVDITIPNALVLANHIINYSSSAEGDGLILHAGVTIGYDAPWQKVHELLVRAAERTGGIEKEPRPFVLQTGLDDFYVKYELNAYTKTPNDMARIYSELHANIQDSFNEGGVEIMSPHYAAVRDGNRMAVPDDYLPKNYRAPSFSLFTRRPSSESG